VNSENFMPSTLLMVYRDGPTPSDKPGGPTTDQSGPARVPAKDSRSRVKGSASKIRGISGQISAVSFASAALQQSLENRLAPLLHGSTSCEVTWKPWATPWGQPLSKPRARERTISEIDISLWPTPTVHGDHNRKGASQHSGNGLSTQVKEVVIGLWPTMTSNAPAKDGYNKAGNSAGQVAIKKIVVGQRPTATASDHKSRSASQATLDRNARPRREIQFAVWSTIRASDGEKGGPNQSFGAGGSPLPSQVSKVASTLSAQTENGGGSLHPQFAGWLLGYGPEFLNCAPSATVSTFVQRRRS